MTNSVNKISLVADIWKNFYDRVKAQVTTVTITGPIVITVQNYVSAMPDAMLDVKSNYPIIVVKSPKVPTGKFTEGKKVVDGTITIETYTNQSEAGDKLISLVNNSIETYIPDLGQVGFRRIEVEDSDDDFVKRGKIKIHVRTTTFSFEINILKEGY